MNRIAVCFMVALQSLHFFCGAQVCKTDAIAIHSKADLQESIKKDPSKRLVALQSFIPGLAIDLRYAGTNNFTKTVLYRHPFACMRIAPATALLQVQQELNKKGLGLKIYDAFRPFSVTCHIWQLVPDRHYAANPRKGSHHNRGIALDLTIIDLKIGKELDMGTGFDNFTDSAHHDFAQLPPKVIANRRLLKNIMWQHGFNFVPTEWWHYHWRDKATYEVIDLDFDDISDLVSYK
jgi:D-alanyl-D-alanine dipeptidase